MERTSESEIRIRSVATLPEYRGRGVGRALVEAIAGVASASRLVAETDDDAVGFYRRCGFAIEEIEPRNGHPRFRCSRMLEPLPVEPAAVRAFTLNELESAIRKSWGRDTSDDPDEWAGSTKSPSRASRSW
jgi:GNAT superfamily N-acetyltransferase